MKNNTILMSSLVGMALLMSACGNNNTTNNGGDESNQQAKISQCTYSYDAASTTVSWTAYKFTEMVAVNGKFTTMEVSGHAPSEKRLDVFKNATFKIPVSSINTSNPDRDSKIQKFFFGSLVNSMELTGTVKGIEGDENTGKFILGFGMNDTTGQLELAYRVSGDTLIASGILNTENWNAQKGIAALNKECKDLHKGADGVSKLWSEVSLEIRTILGKKCD